MTEKPNYPAIHSWALYDFASTVFSMNVISLYFALWVTVDKGGQDILYGAALSVSMLAVALSAPVLGAISDQTGRQVGTITLLSLICIVCTAALGVVDNLFAALILFVFANYGYQTAMVLYHSMLPHISRGVNPGPVSGYGIAMGYLGSITGLVAVKPFVTHGGRSAAFIPTAIIFLIFSIPAFLFVKDPAPNLAAKPGVWQAFRTLKQTFREARSHRNLFHFILVHFLILDVVNTAIAFMSIYANKVIGFNNNQITSFLITSTVAAMTSAYFIGWLVKHKGTIWSYWMVLWIWVTALSIAVTSQSQTIFWAVGPLAGMGMGGVWVVSRPLLVELSPAEKRGEFFGLYGLAGRASSILGPMLWGTIVFLLEKTGPLKYRAAIFALWLISVATLFLFRPLAHRLSLRPPQASKL